MSLILVTDRLMEKWYQGCTMSFISRWQNVFYRENFKSEKLAALPQVGSAEEISTLYYLHRWVTSLWSADCIVCLLQIHIFPESYRTIFQKAIRLLVTFLALSVLQFTYENYLVFFVSLIYIKDCVNEKIQLQCFYECNILKIKDISLEK